MTAAPATAARRPIQARTSTTAWSVPCWFQTFSRAGRSGLQCPFLENLINQCIGVTVERASPPAGPEESGLIYWLWLN